MSSPIPPPPPSEVVSPEVLGTVLGFEGAIAKTGYLQKRAKKSGANWKRRYFVLKGSALVYYESHKNLDDARGDLLFTSDCFCRDVREPKYDHCFEIVSGFETLRVAASSPQEMADWKAAVEKTVATLSCMQRGFLDLKVKNTLFSGSKWQRKFFVLHSNALTYHQDHYNTYKTQGEFPITTTTAVACADDKTLELVDDARTLSVRARDAADLEQWHGAIENAISKLRDRDALASKRGQANDEHVLRDGYLATQPPPCGEDDHSGDVSKWPRRFYALTSSALYQADADDSPDASNVFLMEPGCSVWPTKFHPFAFEFVTPTTVLHAYADSKEDAQAWIAALRDVAGAAPGLASDPLLFAAKSRGPELRVRYDVTFRDEQKLNVVLERANEWAIVKSVKKESSTTIEEGSVLVKINGEATTLQTYDDTIRSLAGWRPPLTLTFAKAPAKAGWLSKQARGRRSGRRHRSNWKRRWFELKHGRLAYFANSTEKEPKDTIYLLGCAVSLVSRRDQQLLGASTKEFCFRLSFGVGELVMQASSLEEMLDWATTLYHGTALANGGGYLLALERNGDEEDTKKNGDDDDARGRHRQAIEAALLERRRRSSLEEEGSVVPSSPRQEDDDDDDDDEGAVSQHVPGEEAPSVAVTPLTDDELGRVYDVVDADHTGAIDSSGFVALLLTVGADTSQQTQLELDLFHACDTDNTGTLSRRQFIAGVQAYVASRASLSSQLLAILDGIRAYQSTGTVKL